MQLEAWCEEGSRLATAAVVLDVSTSMNDLTRFMETHSSLNLDEIWTSEATYVHVLTQSLQVGSQEHSLESLSLGWRITGNVRENVGGVCPWGLFGKYFFEGGNLL